MTRWIAQLMIVALFATGTLAEDDPNGVSAVIWPTVGDSVAELRLGASWHGLEAYVAPRFDKTLASEGDVCTDIRVYGIYDALSADIVSDWFGELPEGTLYGGLFGGWEFEDAQTEAGWLVGSRAVLQRTEKHVLYWSVEYQQAWQTFVDGDDRYVLMTGPCLKF